MSNFARESGLAALAFARQMTVGFLDDIPKDKYVHQPMPGANHALWIAGHIAWTDDDFLSTFGVRDKKLPASWHKACGYQSKPTTKASDYPAMTEILDKLATLREELGNWFKSMSDEKMRSPLPEDWKTFAPNYAGLMNSMACHESLHAGQLTVVRKSLGLAPKFG